VALAQEKRQDHHPRHHGDYAPEVNHNWPQWFADHPRIPQVRIFGPKLRFPIFIRGTPIAHRNG
jgi:hypothetical protein